MEATLPLCQNRPVPTRSILSHHAISRVDRRGMRGWRVHIKRLSQDHTGLLHDHQHGGRAGAYRAAQAWYHEALRLLPPPLRTSRSDVRSKTGQVGVSFEQLRRPTGTVYSCYRAAWPDSRGGYVKRAFSLGKHGKRRAFMLAVHARQTGLAQLARSLRDRIEHEIAQRTARRRSKKP